MKKIWLLKVLGICLCVSASIFLFTTHCQPLSYSPQDQAIMAAGGLPSWFEFPDWSERPYPYAGYYQPFNPYLYQQQFNSYGNDFGSSPFGYQQYYPSYPYGIPYGNDMVGYGYPTFNNPYGVGYQQSFDPYGPGYQQPPLYATPSFNGNEYWDPYRNTWMVYDEWYNMSYEKFIPYNGNPNPYPSPWGQYGQGYYYVGYPPPTPKLSYLRI